MGLITTSERYFLVFEGDTRWNQNRLQKELKKFQHHEADIRDRSTIIQLIADIKPDTIVHTAAQQATIKLLRYHSMILTSMRLVHII